MNDMNEPVRALSVGKSPSPSVGATIAMDRLRAQMERALEEQGQREVELEGDGDPLAILEVDPRLHPVQRYLDESAPGRASRRNTKNRIATVYRFVCGRPGPTSLDELYRYPWHMLTRTDLERFSYALRSADYKPATRNALRATLRSLIHNCRKAGLMSAYQDQVLTDLLRLERFDPERVGREIPEHELPLILLALLHEDSWRVARDRAMVTLLWATGLRVSELCNIELSHWNQATGWITLPKTKNGRSHRVPVAAAVVPYLEAWLNERGTDPGYLFLALPSRLSKPMCMQVVKRTLDRATEEAKLERITAHDFRRTLATRLLRQHDPATVMRLLNHKSLNSTLAYDRASEDLQSAAVESMPIPDLGSIMNGEVA